MSADATTAVCGGGLPEDSTGPLDECAACVVHVRIILPTLLTGYEDDRMPSDSAVDSRVLIFIDVVKCAALDACE